MARLALPRMGITRDLVDRVGSHMTGVIDAPSPRRMVSAGVRRTHMVCGLADFLTRPLLR
jgi:hypothetical protein